MTVESAALDAGIAAADGQEKTAEYADVKRWAEKVEQARKFDEEARKQYAKDRRYARGDSSFDVDANIVGTNIDILESFLYAKDPDVDVGPATSCEPPSLDSLKDAAAELVKQDPQVLQAVQLAMQVTLAQTGDQSVAQQAGEMAGKAVAEQLIQTQFAAMQAKYAKRQRDNKAYAQAIEIVVSRLWKDAGLKPRGRRWVRSGLTVGIGIIKASWQERTAPSPETVQAINDLQANVKKAAQLRAQMEDASGDDLEAQTAAYERQIASLQGQAERVIARGFVVDNVQAEDFQVATGYPIAMHCDAPWNAHRIPMLATDAQAEFSLTGDQIKTAARYTSRKPEMVQNKTAAIDTSIEAKDADAYTQAGDSKGEAGDGAWIMVWEIWDRDSGHVLTMIEGVKCWVKPAWQPTATTRFYPFFIYATSEVDGQRHPQSLVSRSAKLADEYNRIGTAEKEHRAKIQPGTIFNKGAMSAEDVRKVERSRTQEMTGITPTNPKADMRSMFVQKTYAAIDPALYDRAPIKFEMDMIWGVQEALQGAVTVQKTLGEAEIQQSGFQARSGGRRDLMEGALQELAQYTAEVARAHLDAKDVQGMAGDDALWPAYTGPNDLTTMVNIQIRAGSSGKPNTTAEREAWASQLPLLQSAIMQIGQLRQSLSTDVADCLEKLLRITAERSGDRLDVDGLLPKAGPPPVPGMPGMPGPNAPPGAPPNQPAAPVADPLAA